MRNVTRDASAQRAPRARVLRDLSVRASAPRNAALAGALALSLVATSAAAQPAPPPPSAPAPAPPSPAAPPPRGPAPSAPAPAAPPAPSGALAPIDVDAGPGGASTAPPKERATTDSAAPTEPPPPAAIDVSVQERRPPPSRGASDIPIQVGQLRVVPRKDASSFLSMAPGFFLTNEGGTGHAERIYLRGFDAREGQDVEISLDGVPLNQSGNYHGNGIADTGFIIPELVEAVRVNEGPFDPRQGNYAVAGSADYHLGLARRGLTAKTTYGNFNTARMLFLWGPDGMSNGTFAGAELYTTDGYGQNRDAKRASGMAQYEGAIGEHGSYRILATGYGVKYHQAGPLREDDVKAGRKGFYDTYDTRQGGSASRFGLSGDVQVKSGDILWSQQLFLSRSTFGLRENLTGFLLDTQEPQQQPHGQRGDLYDLDNRFVTYGAKGSGRISGKLFGQKQELELGYAARGDHVDALRERLLDGTNVPYAKDADFASELGDFGLFADAQMKPARWLTFRGGLRADAFTYDVRNNCAVRTVSRPDPQNPPGDVSCLDQQRFGTHREPDQHNSTASVKLMPRGSVILGPFAGFSLSGSAGLGVRSVDPSYVAQDVATPFASITSYEGGVTFLHSFTSMSVEARSIFFGTHVDRDQIFSETEGRSIIGGGTTRSGWSGSARLTGDFFDTSTSVTLVKSRFDDTGLLVPYVPDVVVRSDSALFHELPLPTLLASHFKGTAGLGVNFIGKRALPYGQRSDTIFTLDGQLGVSWKWLTFEAEMQNILGTQYRQAEYNYVSDFKSQPAPTLVAARHFIAGAPRTVLFSLTGNIGGS